MENATSPKAQGLEKALERMLTYLTRAHQEDVQGAGDTSFAWDWEMLQEAVYADSAKAVYSGVLWHGLSCLREATDSDQSARVVITEGTRRELMEHLLKLIGGARRQQRNDAFKSTPPPREGRAVGLNAFAARRDWKEVLGALRDATQVETRLNRVLLLLEQHARPAPMDADAVSSAEVDFYERQLAHIRPAAASDQRNLNDAFNLASVVRIRRVESGATVMVTATKAVARANAALTIDPIEFALRAEIRRQYPNPLHRREAVLQIINRVIHKMLNLSESGYAQDPMSRGMRRRDVPDFLVQITAMDQDPALCELARLLAKAQQAVENAMAQTDAVPTDLLLPDNARPHFDAIVTRVRSALKLFGGNALTLADLGLAVRKTDSFEHADQYALEDLRGLPIIEAEVSADALALRWETDVSLLDFAEALARSGDSLGLSGRPAVAVRNASCQELVWEETSPNNLARTAIRLAGDRKIALMLVQWGTSMFWYTAAADGRWPIGPRRTQLARVAVRADHSASRQLLAELHQDTALVWLFPELVETFLRDVTRELNLARRSEPS